VCVQESQYTLSKPSGNPWPCQGGGGGECVLVHWYTTSKQLGTSGQAREGDAASVYGYTGAP